MTLLASRRCALALLVSLVASMWVGAVLPAAARAHYVGSARQWKSTVTSVTPASARSSVDATVTYGDSDVQIRLHAPGTRDTLVIYDASTPRRVYAVIGANGVWLNTASARLRGMKISNPQRGIDPGAPQRTFVRYSTEPQLTWHDPRVRWLGRRPPSSVDTSSSKPQRVQSWQIPIAWNGRPGAIRGHLDYVGGSSAQPSRVETIVGGVVVLLLIAACIAALRSSARATRAASASSASDATDATDPAGFPDTRE